MSRFLQYVGEKFYGVIVDIYVLTILNHSVEKRLKQQINILSYLLRLTANNILDLLQTLVGLRSI